MILQVKHQMWAASKGKTRNTHVGLSKVGEIGRTEVRPFAASTRGATYSQIFLVRHP